MSRLKILICRKNILRSVNHQLHFSAIFSFIQWHFFRKLTKKINLINASKISSKNLSHFENFFSEMIDFKVWECQKTSIICCSGQTSDQRRINFGILSFRVLWEFELIWIYRLEASCNDTVTINHRKQFLMYWVARSRIDLQISIFVFFHELLVFNIIYQEYVKSESHTPSNKTLKFIRKSSCL